MTEYSLFPLRSVDLRVQTRLLSRLPRLLSFAATEADAILCGGGGLVGAGALLARVAEVDDVAHRAMMPPVRRKVDPGHDARPAMR